MNRFRATYLMVVFAIFAFEWCQVRAPAGTVLIGATNGGVIYDIDTATGLASNPRDTGIDGLTGIAPATDGQVYSLGIDFATSLVQLFQVDLATGTATLIGGTEHGLALDLAVDPATSELYTLFRSLGVSGTGLRRVNIFDGSMMSIGSITDNPTALTFGFSGDLFVLGSNSLLVIDPVTAQELSSVPLQGAFHGVSLAPNLDGSLLTTGIISPGMQGLYTLYPATGEAHLIGPTGLGETGISSLAVVPEPATVLLLLSGISVILRRK